MIRESYARYSRTLESGVLYTDPAKTPDSPIVPKVKIATGATGKEVIELGLLPFSIRPVASAVEVDQDDVERIMIDSGAVDLPSGVELRFPTSRMASDVRARLLEEMPEVHWAIDEEVRALDDWSGLQDK